MRARPWGYMAVQAAEEPSRAKNGPVEPANASKRAKQKSVKLWFWFNWEAVEPGMLRTVGLFRMVERAGALPQLLNTKQETGGRGSEGCKPLAPALK